MDIVSAMEKDAGVRLSELKVDGGASRDNLLMQFQADMVGAKVVRPKVTETTAMGACYLAGLAVGFWDGLEDIASQWQVDRVFEPSADQDSVSRHKALWKDAVKRALSGK